ncbi:MAG: TIGR00375 family protein [Firmicutes bacterium HGW-Firmicutes-14]|nr:MAG: TIGR00375 family protein [Firmicutes bacterium HGW-Firmicutes-14]
MKKYFADLHVHIGRTGNGAPVKITASRDLTVASILEECRSRKGIDLVGIIDAASPNVQEDLSVLIDRGLLQEAGGGGLRYRDSVTLIPGGEVETTDRVTGPEGLPRDRSAHCLCYFPDLEGLRKFTREISKPGRVKNPTLSSQKCNMPMGQVVELVHALGGTAIPAHAFTPHKGLYGSCVKSFRDIMSQAVWDMIPAVELGLSSDTYYADMISELADKTFVSNSDAHSLPKIGREYNVIKMEDPNYREFLMALRREKGRAVTANYGFDPKLGKYHRTFCEECGTTADAKPPVPACTTCGMKADGRKVVMGVLDRIYVIRDRDGTNRPGHRPSYHHQIPLQNLPGIGKKTLEKLLSSHTEMDVLHRLTAEEIAGSAGPPAAEIILLAREGRLEVSAGGGGHYGRVVGRKQ